jgi:hypothetical protein
MATDEDIANALARLQSTNVVGVHRDGNVCLRLNQWESQAIGNFGTTSATARCHVENPEHKSVTLLEAMLGRSVAQDKKSCEELIPTILTSIKGAFDSCCSARSQRSRATERRPGSWQWSAPEAKTRR